MSSESKPRVIVSPVGASVLNGAPQKFALNQQQLAATDQALLNEFLAQKQEEFSQSTVETIRKQSAELNGIYAIYNGSLPKQDKDIHILIATDTAVGQACAHFVEDFLLTHGFTSVQVISPKNLAMRDLDEFNDGIKELLRLLQEVLPGYQENQYQILFNLVASFKSLQGYLATFGMFYADEIVYVFENTTVPITIPRLPIKIDTDSIEQYKVPLALMIDGNGIVALDTVQGLAPTMFDAVDNKVMPSKWGELIWGQIRDTLYDHDIFEFPRLEYTQEFRTNLMSLTKTLRIATQKTLAMVSIKLEESNGNTAILRGGQSGGILYSRLKNKEHNKRPVDHFRITDDIRVICQPQNGLLVLLGVGHHSINEDF